MSDGPDPAGIGSVPDGTGQERSGLLVPGSVNTDLMVRLTGLPAAGETVLGEDAVHRPGGNQAVAAALTGAPVSIAGRVGDDDRATALRHSLESAGADTGELRTAEGRSTGLAVVLLTRDGENSIVVSPGANHALVPDDVDRLHGRIAGSRLLLMQMELPLPVVARACEVAGQVGTPVVLNLAPATQEGRDLLGSVDVLVVNRSEAELLLDRAVTGLDDVRRAGQELLASGLAGGRGRRPGGRRPAHRPARSRGRPRPRRREPVTCGS